MNGKIFAKGFVGGVVGLAGFYYLLLFLITKDPQHPLTQFMLYQPWMSLLIIGFGIQMGLYLVIKRDGLIAGTSTALSTTAMIACCAHHALDFLPILGFSAATLFLSNYQQEFLMLGLASNVVGIVVMLRRIL